MEINRKIKEARLERGYTLDELARATQLTKGYLSKIERSANVPPFSTLETIAVALNLNLAGLLEKPRGSAVTKNIDVFTRTEHSPLTESTAGYAYQALVREYQRKYMSPFLFQIKKGWTKYFKHDGEEFVYMLEGNVTLEYEAHRYALGKGDSFYLDSRIKHRFWNAREKPALLLAVNYTYRRF